MNPWLRVHRSTHTRATTWWLNDAKGIPLCRVCAECIALVVDSYPPEVMGISGRYEDVVEDRIEENDP